MRLARRIWRKDVHPLNPSWPYNARLACSELSREVHYDLPSFSNNGKSPFNSENRVKLTPQVIRLFSTIVPGKPELSVEQDEATVYVSWTLEDKNGIIKNYNVMYIRDDDSADMMNLTMKKMKQNFEDLRAGKTYEFQVRVSQ